MKRIVLSLTLAFLASSTAVMAQDDMYFVPKKETKEEKAKRKAEKEAKRQAQARAEEMLLARLYMQIYHNDIDLYNRHIDYQKGDTLYFDSLSTGDDRFVMGDSLYDVEKNYEFTKMMERFNDMEVYIVPRETWEEYNYYNTWGYIPMGTHLSRYPGYWGGFYPYHYAFYDMWYDPWYHDYYWGWDGYHRVGGFYDSWYGYHRPFYGGYYGGGGVRPINIHTVANGTRNHRGWTNDSSNGTYYSGGSSGSSGSSSRYSHGGWSSAGSSRNSSSSSSNSSSSRSWSSSSSSSSSSSYSSGSSSSSSSSGGHGGGGGSRSTGGRH